MSLKRVLILATSLIFAVSSLAAAAISEPPKSNTQPAASKQAKISLTAPQGGQVLYTGEQVKLSWDYSGNIGDTMFIQLVHHAGDPAGHGLFNRVIAQQASVGVGGHGSLSFTVPDVPTGYTYSIQCSAANAGAGSQKFTIVNPKQQPTIKLTTPNGGETWYKGRTYAVTWTHVADPGQKVIITLNTAGDPAKFRKLGEAPAGANGAGSFTWQVPTDIETGQDYQVWVANGAYHAKFIDRSDGNFAIKIALPIKPSNNLSNPPPKPNFDRDKLDPQPEPPMK